MEIKRKKLNLLNDIKLLKRKNRITLIVLVINKEIFLKHIKRLRYGKLNKLIKK